MAAEEKLSPDTTHGSITEMAAQWKQMKQSDIALHNESIDALRVMSHEDLARLAYGVLETLEAADKYSYAISYLEDHLEDEGDLEVGWIIAQPDKDGGWNKWAKAHGGYAPESGPSGDWLVFRLWKDAKKAHDHIDPSIRQYSRIYPVVLSAGREPRTTDPRYHV
jgi:hypothetical protein